MVIKLYGDPKAINVHRAVIAFLETNTPYEIHDVDWRAGELGTEASLAKHPFGQMPYMDDDGFILFESRAIARYVAQKAHSPLVPSGNDLRALALYDQAQNIEAFDFEPSVGGLVLELYAKPSYRGLDPDEERVEEYKATLSKKLAGYERILSKTRYLTGDEVSLIDLFHIIYGARLAPAGVNFLENEKVFPNVARWWKDITSRPSWQAMKDLIQV